MKKLFSQSTYLSFLLVGLGTIGLLLSSQFKRVFLSGQQATANVAVVDRATLAERRPYDVLSWNSLQKGDVLYAGDYLRTGRGGKVRLSLLTNKGGSVAIHANSYVRIGKDDQHLTLEIRQGVVDAQGVSKEEIVSTRSDFVAPVDTSEKREPPAAPATQDKNLVNPSQEDAQSTQVAKEEVAAEVSKQKPQIEDIPNLSPALFGTHFLYGPKTQSLFVALSDRCKTPVCLLEISFASGATERLQFVQGKIIAYRFQVGQHSDGLIKWTLRDGNEKKEGNFFVQRLDQKVLKQALDQGLNVEILE